MITAHSYWSMAGGLKREREGEKNKQIEPVHACVCMCVCMHIHTQSIGTALRCLSGFQYSLGLSKIFMWHCRRNPSSLQVRPVWVKAMEPNFSFWQKPVSGLTPNLVIHSLHRDVNATFPVLQVLTRMACYLCCCSHDLRPERPHGAEHRQKPEDNEHPRGLNSSQSFILNKQCS